VLEMDQRSRDQITAYNDRTENIHDGNMVETFASERKVR